MNEPERVAIITGAARGIGRAFARALGELGTRIAILDIDRDEAEATAALLQSSGLDVKAWHCDISDELEVNEVVTEVGRTFGRIDVLVNNAALHLMSWSCPVTEASSERWRQILDVNVIGIVNCARASRPFLKESGSGVIVNMASVSAFTAVDVYGITKLAVRGLTVALAKEFAIDNIRVCGIAPGPMDSEAALADLPPELIARFVQDLQLIKRPGRMGDLLGALKFLSSEAASFITGETLVVGGGYPLRI